MALNSFYNSGSDVETLKSLENSVLAEHEELAKAMNKAGLVLKDVQVQGKNGTFTRKQWVKADDQSQNQAASAHKYTRDDKDNAFRKYSKMLLRYADKGSNATLDDVSSVIGEVETLYKDGGIYKKDYELLGKYMANAQRAARERVKSQNSTSSKITAESVSKDWETLEKVNGIKHFESHRISGGTQLPYGRSYDKNGKPTSAKFVEPNEVKKGHITMVKYLKSQGFTIVSEDSYLIKDSYVKTSPVSTGLELFITHLKDSNGSDLYVKSRIGGWSEKQFVSVTTDSQNVDTDKVWDKQGNKPVKQKSVNSQKLSLSEAKAKTKEVTAKVTDRKLFMDRVKAQGITWKENDHAGINWMRCLMAMNKHFENGGTFDPDKK